MSSRRSRSGGSVDGDDVEAIEQILAEACRLHLRRRSRLVAAMMRTSTATLVSLPTGRKVRSCSTRSSLTCSCSGSSPISSRKSVPPSALRKQPGAVGDGAGERAAHVAEQLALDQVLGNRAAVDGDEALVAARAAGVDGARDDLLAGAALAGDQHGRVGVRDAVDQARMRGDGRAGAVEAVGGFGDLGGARARRGRARSSSSGSAAARRAP